jgi:hypothetical protein
MPLMLVVKRRMGAIKQPSKRDNVSQRPPNITRLLKNNNSRNIIKRVFNVDLHHDLIRVWVEGLDAKRDGFTSFKGQNSKLVGG